MFTGRAGAGAVELRCHNAKIREAGTFCCSSRVPYRFERMERWFRGKFGPRCAAPLALRQALIISAETKRFRSVNGVWHE
jgi:hypothetical protein